MLRKPLDKVTFGRGDITKNEIIEKIRKHIDEADVII